MAGTPGIHVNFLLILALAVAATAIAGTLIGVPTLRLRGDYIAIVTLAFGEIIGQIVANGRGIELFGGTLTSGPIGIGPIDRIELPLVGRFGALDLRPWYWFALVLVALALVVNVNLRDSRIGRAWVAMRDDEPAAASAGIPIVRTKLAGVRDRRRVRRDRGRVLRLLPGRRQRGPVRVLLLDLHLRDGRARRPRIDSGASWSARSSSRSSTTTCCPTSCSTFRARSAWTFDLSAISSGIYGAILVVVMLLRPQGLVPAGGTIERSENGRQSLHRYDLSNLGGRARA